MKHKDNVHFNTEKNLRMGVFMFQSNLDFSGFVEVS